MKYIRTKDGKIFDTQYEPKVFKYNWNAKFIIDDNNLIVYDTVFKDRIANHGQILKQANIFEELCDEFVVDNWKEKNKPILCKYVKERNAIYYCDEHGINWLYIPDLLKMKIVIYGAIWTDKGLIYVAKMNEKGELELL